LYSKLYKLLTAAIIVSLSAGAHAEQENQVRILDEIVVTADFRDTSLMETAGSVSVVQDTTIFDRGGQHLEEVLNVLPNVNFSSGASRARFIQVRGIGDLEQFVDPKYFPSVGVTVDDVHMNGMAGSAVTMDVQQIEVLRGNARIFRLYGGWHRRSQCVESGCRAQWAADEESAGSSGHSAKQK
jgi:outer membrane receptor for ferrienterochelin and colicin